MFSIWELGIIGGVALLVYGPEQLPDVVRSASRGLRQFRELSQSLTANTEHHAEDQLKENEARAQAADKLYQAQSSTAQDGDTQ